MNVTWADYVLGEFPDDEAFARVTLVEDPDTLLADETIFAKLNQGRKGGLSPKNSHGDTGGTENRDPLARTGFVLRR